MVKNNFFTMISKNVLHPGMLIFMDLWTKNDCFQNDLNKRAFPQNIVIYGFMDKNDFFQNDLKISSFS